MSNNKQIREKLERLQELLIDQLIKELEQGDSTNISVANTLLSTNKVVTQPETEASMHEKIKKVAIKNKFPQS